MTDLRSPFPWFGGKRRVAADVWAALGDVDSYVEPFFGSGAVLLERPAWRVARGRGDNRNIRFSDTIPLPLPKGQPCILRPDHPWL